MSEDERGEEPGNVSGMSIDEVANLADVEEKLGLAIEKLATANEELKGDRSERKKHEKHVRGAISLGALLLLVTLVASVTSVIGTWIIIDGRSVSRVTQKQILDCTKPDGECAKQQRVDAQATIREIARQNAEANIEIGACLVDQGGAAVTLPQYRVCAKKNLQNVLKPVPAPSPQSTNALTK